MAEFVEVSVPARPEFLSLVRLAVGSVAARLDLSMEQLDDLQLASEELCLSLLRPAAGADGRLSLRLGWDDATIEVHGRLDGPRGTGGAAASATGVPEALSEQILDALVDEHGRATVDGAATAWLRKRREQALPPS